MIVNTILTCCMRYSTTISFFFNDHNFFYQQQLCTMVNSFNNHVKKINKYFQIGYFWGVNHRFAPCRETIYFLTGKECMLVKKIYLQKNIIQHHSTSCFFATDIQDMKLTKAKANPIKKIKLAVKIGICMQRRSAHKPFTCLVLIIFIRISCSLQYECFISALKNRGKIRNKQYF